MPVGGRGEALQYTQDYMSKQERRGVYMSKIAGICSMVFKHEKIILF